MDKPLREEVLDYLNNSGGLYDYIDLKKPFKDILDTKTKRGVFKRCISLLKKDGLIDVSLASNLVHLTTVRQGRLIPLAQITIICRLTQNGLNSFNKTNHTTINNPQNSIISHGNTHLRDFDAKIIHADIPPSKKDTPHKTKDHNVLSSISVFLSHPLVVAIIVIIISVFIYLKFGISV